MLLAAGCRTTGPRHDPPNGGRTWPPPPAPARIAYQQSAANPAELGMRQAWWQSTLGFFTGSRRTREPFMKPFGLHASSPDTLCMTDTGARTVYHFDRKRRRFKRWDHVGPTHFRTPVAVVQQGERLFVADTGLGKIIVFNLDGKPEFEISEGLERPAGLAIAGERLYVADAQRHQVVIFTLQGQYLDALGTRGEGTGTLNFPTHVAVDQHSGVVYVTDAMNFRIQPFDPDGTPGPAIGAQGENSGHFSRPKGIALGPEGELFVADALFDNIQVFDAAGRFLMHWGSAGTKPGEFWMPGGICLNATGEIFVADAYNRRIQIFRLLDAPPQPALESETETKGGE